MGLIESLNEPTQEKEQAQEQADESLQGQLFQERTPDAPPQEVASNSTFSSEANEDRIVQEVAQERAAPFSSQKDVQESPETWSPEYTQMGFIEKAGRSFVKGIGEQVIGGYGDMLQVGGSLLFGMDTANGNMASRWLQEQGAKVAEGTENYLTEDFRNQMEENAWSFSTLMKPDFWSNTVAEGVPLLIEMVLMSKGAGLLTKGTAKSLTRGLGSHGARGTAGRTAKKTKDLSGAFKKEGKEAIKSLDDAIEVKGKGIAGLIDDAGDLSQKGTKVAETANDLISGGISMNLLSGAMNAAELINTNKVLKDENGNAIYSDEELRSMAANSMINNAKYIPMDMLSWGVTYGKQAGMANRLVKNRVGALKRVFTPSQQIKIASNEFKSVTKPLYKKIFNAAAKGGQKLSSGVLEGFEETFQETFEEYAKLKAKAKVDGLDDNMSLKDYMTFYMSKENEQTKIAAFGLGLIGGGGSAMAQKATQSVKSILNIEAEKASLGYQKSELLKRIVDPKNSDLYNAQQVLVAEQLINNHEANVDNDVFVDELLSSNIINEEQSKALKEQAKVISQSWQEADQMNVKGKFAYAFSKQKTSIYNDFLAEQVETSNARIAGLKENISDKKLSEELIKEEQKKIEDINFAVNHALTQQQIIQESLIADRVIDALTPNNKSIFVTDENGKETLLNGLTKEKYDEYYNMDDDEVFKAIRDQDSQTIPQATASLFGSLTNFGKKIFNRAKEGAEKAKDSAEEIVEEVAGENENLKDIVEKGGEFFNKAGDLVNKVTGAVIKTAKAIKDALTTEDDVLSNNDNFNKFLNDNEVIDEEAISGIKDTVKSFIGELTAKDDAKEGYDITEEVGKLPKGEAKSFLEQSIKDGSIGALKSSIETEAVTNQKNKDEAEAKTKSEEEAKAAEDKKNDPLQEDSYEERKALAKKKGVSVRYFNQVEKAFENDSIVSFTDEDGKVEKRPIKDIRERNEIQSNPELNIEFVKKVNRNKGGNIEGNINNPFEKPIIDHTDINTIRQQKQWINSHVGVYHRGLEPIFQAAAINSYNRANGLQPRVMPLMNLYKAIGEQAVGYSIATSIFIEESFWDQDSIFMHEHAHIYYAVTGNNEETKNVVKEARKNKIFTAQVEKTYASEVLFKLKKRIPGWKLKKGDIVKQSNLDAIKFDTGKDYSSFAERLPNEEQDIINDELFAHYLAGPLSRGFDKYFNTKQDFGRQNVAQRWWGWFKAKNKNVQKLVENFNPESKNINITHTDFKNVLKDKDVSTNGRKAVILTAKQEAESTRETYKDKFRKSIQKFEDSSITDYESGEIDGIIRDRVFDSQEYEDQMVEVEKNINFGRPLENFLKDPFENVLGEFQDIEDEVALGIEGSMYEKTFERTEKRAGILFQLFMRQYQNKQINEGVSTNKVTTEDTFKSHIQRMALELSNPFEFMRMVLEPAASNEVGNEFMKFLDLFKDDKYSVLYSMHMLYKNVTTVNVVGQEIRNGVFTVDNQLSPKEIQQVDFVQEQLNRLLDTDPKFQELYNEIIKGEVTPEQATEFINAFRGNGFLHIPSVLKGGLLQYKQNLYPFADYFTRAYLDNNTRQPGTNKNYDPKSFIDFDFKGFVTDVILTSRKYSSRGNVNSKEKGISAPSKQISFGFARQIDKMRDDLLGGMSKLDFTNKYSRNKGPLKKILKKDFVNPLIEHIYDKYASSNELPLLSMINGIMISDNDGGKETETVELYKDSVSTSLTAQDILRFDHTDGQYLTTTNTMAESRRIMAIEMPKVDSSGIIVYDNKIDVQKGKGKENLDMAYAIYLQSFDYTVKDPADSETFPISRAEYEQAYAESVRDLRSRLNAGENNKAWEALKDDNYNYDDNLRRTFLNAKGKKMVADYVLSTMINKSSIHNLFTPSVPINSIIKRNKQNGSPIMILSPSLRTDLMFIGKDMQQEYDANGNLNEFIENDSGQYVLEVDAKKMEATGRVLTPFNKSYKILNAHVETENEQFKDKYVNLKGYTTILSEELVKKFPRYEPIWRAMMDRRNKFEEWARNKGLEESEFFGDGGYDYMLIASPFSSEKGGMFSKAQIDLQDGTKDKEGLLSVNTMQDPEGVKGFHKIHDTYNYKDGEFIGFDGSNFGIQMVFDQVKTKAPVAIQTIQAIETAASLSGKPELIKKVLTPFYNSVRANFKEMFSKNMENTIDISKFVLDRANKVLIDPIQKFVLEQAGPSILNPIVGNFTKSQLVSDGKATGNNLKGNGSILTQKSGTIYKIGKTKEARGKRLRSYREATTTRNGVKEVVIMPVEGIVAGFLEDNGHRKRKEFTLKSDIKNALKNSNEFIKEFKLSNLDKKIYEDNIDNFIKLHTIIENGVEKYYIPGELVMITRVPNTSPAFTGIMEIVDFDPTGAANIMVPGEFKQSIGSDDDGDTLFLNSKYKNVKGQEAFEQYNEFVDQTIEMWLTPEVHRVINRPLDNVKETRATLDKLDAYLGKKGKTKLPFSPQWDEGNFDNSLGARQTLGQAFVYKKIYDILAAYGTKTVVFDRAKDKVFKDGKLVSVGTSPARFSFNNGASREKLPVYQDINNDDVNVFGVKKIKGGERSHVMNMFAQYILDSTNNGFADRYNITTRNSHIPFGLAAVGFDLEDIYIFMNHPTTLAYSEQLTKAANPFLDYESKKQMITKLRTKAGIEEGSRTRFDFDMRNPTTNKKWNSSENQNAVLNIIEQLNAMESNLDILQRIYKGHKTLSTDPRIIAKQLKDVEKLITNGQTFQPVFEFSEEFRNSPQLKNLKQTATELRTFLQKMDIADNEVNEGLLNEILDSTKAFDVTEALTKRYSKGIQLNALGKMFGINNSFTAAELKQMPRALRDRLRTFREEDAENGNNLFLTDILEIGPKDGSEESRELAVAKNGKALSFAFTDEQRNMYAEAFNDLPADIKEMIIISDLVSNGWTGKQTIMDLIGKDLVTAVNQEAGIVNANPENFKKTKLELQKKLMSQEMNEDYPSFAKFWVLPTRNVRDPEENQKRSVEKAISLITSTDLQSLQENKRIINIIVKDNRAITPEDSLFLEIDKFTPKEIEEANDKATELKAGKGATAIAFQAEKILKAMITLNDKARIIEKEPIDNEEIIAIPDASKKKPYTLRGIIEKTSSDLIVKKKVNSDLTLPVKSGRAFKPINELFTQKDPVSREQFERAQEWKYRVSPIVKQNTWDRYNREKQESEKIYPEHTPKKLANKELFPDSLLLAKYKEFGMKDIYAYANIMMPLLLEINKRSTAEQSKISKNRAVETGKDITPLQMWFQTNNISSNHPATQSVARQLEVEYKKFLDEKKKYVRKLNAITDKLYDEKFNDKISSFSYVNKVYRAVKTLFKSRKRVYEQLYGNLVEVIEGTDERGNYQKQMKLLSDKILLAKLKSNEITQTEYNFAKTFRDITSELGTKPDGFIPKVAMGKMEYFSSRGLLGLMASEHQDEKAIYNVKMNFHGETVKYKEIEDFYRSQAPNSFKNIKEFRSVKKKATELLRRGLNEDSTPIEIDNVTNNTILGMGMHDKFASGGNVDHDLMSMDLNKALYSYIHTQLFVQGNKKFKGFLKLQSVVDGLMLHNRNKGYNNQNKFVKGVWKDYFLKGKRLASNSTTDKVIDALVKGNFYYILGYKAGLIQHGAYAIGNLVIGKYHNIKHHGGKAWIKGEARYFGLTKSGGLGVRKSRGILDTLNYSDFNIYDEVQMEKQQGVGKVFSDLALLPMDYSEKWIQGVQFLGQLTDEEWNSFDENGKYKPGAKEISLEKISILENEVKRTQGKGYTPTDQRLIQQYSWGKMVMQFSRFIPSMVHDRFAKEDIDIYGQDHIGSLRIVYDTVQRVITGELSPRDYVAYRNSLSPGLTKQLDAGWRGFALASVGMFGGAVLDINWMSEMSSDANYIINPSALEWKLQPSLVRTSMNAVGF